MILLFPPWTPLLFSTLVCTFRYCSNCGLSCSLKFCVYLNMYTVCECVCVCGCSGDYFHTNTNRYLFLFCMIDTKAGASQLFNVWSSGMFAQHRRFTQAVFPMSHALWMCHKKCILYKFYRIHVFITRHALTQWAWQCTLLHKGTIETSSVWPFIKFFFFIDSITIKEII